MIYNQKKNKVFSHDNYINQKYLSSYLLTFIEKVFNKSTNLMIRKF